MLSQKGQRDRKLTIEDVADILAEHVHSFGGGLQNLILDLHLPAQEALWKLVDEAAQERAIEERADREGARY